MVHPPLASPITAVTVFMSGALVTRSAALTGLSGQPAAVRITGLPLGLDDASVRVHADDAAVRSADTTIELTHATAAQAEPAEPASLVTAHEAVARGTLAVQVAEHQLERLDGIHIAKRPRAPRGTPPAAIPTPARLTLVSFASERRAALLSQLGQLRATLVDAEERLRDEEARLLRQSTDRAQRLHQVSKTLVIALRWLGASAAGTLVISYRVPAARWVPSYVLTLNPARTSASIGIRGSVAQNTGEDWSAARITLSTAAALAWCRLPELTSLRIGRRQAPVRATGWREAPVGATELFADFDAIALPAPLAPHQLPAGFGSRAAVGARALRETALSDREGEEEGDEDRSLATDGRSSAPRNRKAMLATPSGAPLPSSAPPPPLAPVLRDMMPRSAPAPASIAMPKRVAGLDGSRLEKNEKKKDYREDAQEELAGGGGAPSEPEAPGVPDHPADDALEYGRLRLLPRHDGGDGSLVAAPTATSRTTADEGDADPGQAFSEMHRREEALARLALPAGCQLPHLPQFAYSYPAVGMVSIPSDGRWHGISLGDVVTPARIAYICVPRADRQVFTIVHLTNPADVPLLAGPVDILIGADYLITAQLPVTVAGGALELGVGVEQGISVARNTTYAESASGLLNGSLTLTHGIAIELANKLRLPVTVEVRERLPVPAEGQADCKLRILAVTPPWKDYRQERQPLDGGHAWIVDLAAGASQTLSVSYQITIPAKSEIAGGNRREA